MKATVERSVFIKALNHVQRVVEKRNTIPILANVLLHARDGRLGLTATDLDIEVVDDAPADVAQEGYATAAAHTLYEIARRLPDGAQVRLELDPESPRLKLSSGRSDFALAALPNEDFPLMTADDLEVRFAIEAGELARLIDKTAFAISTEETRYYLNGVFIHPDVSDDRVLRAVATDGHRLARVDTTLPDGAESMPGVIVPRKTVQELRRLLEDAEGAVAVAVSQAKIRFSFGSVILTSKLIDGAFPDYQRVIPAGNDKVLRVDNAEFAAAVDRVAAVSAEKTRSVKLAMQDDKLRFTVNNPETGSAVEEVSVDYAADALEIGFNARYLLEVSQQIRGETSVLKLADAASPTVVLDEADERCLFVLMPMRV